MVKRPTKISFQSDVNSSPLIVESGRPVSIGGILAMQGAGAAAVSLLEGDATTAITAAGFSIGANTTIVIPMDFIASKGFAVTSSSSSTRVTVFHTNPGA